MFVASNDPYTQNRRYSEVRLYGEIILHKKEMPGGISFL